ncbi:hypothetical protein [Actinomadura macrotermitis]|uniref:Uncharacterized protein n=1 Tax=Actinomadura macrotermitis TaxID=2585200 RepID=A0A7K0C7M8_9ACTN|nr:hypothetical protein [Actinomadura macrotermitis]MQY09460.1 hypothetical protein [Actinomadura macrotermitis]
MRRTTFAEVMEGTVRLDGADRPMRLELSADLPGVLRPWGDIEGALSGRVVVPGWADGPASGRLRVAPVAARRIRYTLEFTALDGRRLRLDGWKSATPRHPVRSMTFLPATVTDADGAVVGEARLRFRLRRDLARFLSGFRFPADPARDPMRPRWRGQPGRLEVWYTTLSDPATGTGVWLHHELVAPPDDGPAREHGWAAVFPPGERPVFGRYEGPLARLQGAAGEIAWDLRESGGGDPLYTFPRWAWERELLPAAQIVPKPTASYDGTVRFGDRVLNLEAAPGGTARIYGHGNARRWAWLHADLGDGDVCEIVTAVSTRPGLRHLPPLTFLRLRTGGREIAATLGLRATIGLPSWTVRGRVGGGRRIHVEVTQRRAETVSVDYADPGGAPAVCHNSERADVRIVLTRGGRVERHWRLEGTAHAEVGVR